MYFKNILLVLIFGVTSVYGQSKGFIVKDNDTIAVQFNLDGLNIRSVQKIEKLQKKVSYELNGKKISSTAYELDGFCIKTDQRDFCFDSFRDEKSGKGSFGLRAFGKKEDKLTIYQFYGSGFIGVNYTVNLGYLIRKENEKDILFNIVTPKKWGEAWKQITADCPTYQNSSPEKITFEDEFLTYVEEYYSQCKK